MLKFRLSSFTLILFIVLTLGCATMKVNFVQKPKESLSAYKYIVILPNSRTKWKTPNEDLTNLFESVGFTVLDKDKLASLNKDERLKVLLCQPEYWLSYYSINTNYGPASSLNYYLTIDVLDILNDRILRIQGKCNSYGEDMMYSKLKQQLSLYYNGHNPNSKIDITKKFNNLESINKNEEDLIAYFDSNLESLNEIEGVWTELKNNTYRIGIFEDKENMNRDYVGIIIDSKHLFWNPKQVKIEFNKTAYKKVFTTNYFMANHSEQGTTAYINEVGMLEMELTNNGEKFKSTYIKNYPQNIDYVGNDKINLSETSGSGSIISESGTVITNYHVIEDKKEITVFFPQQNKEYMAELVLKDINNDLAILRLIDFDFSEISNIPIPFTIISSENSKLGENVFTLGFPLGKILGKSSKFSSGKINSLFGIQDDPRVFQISNPIQPGNSGGPLFNSKGEFIGIVFSSLNAKLFYDSTDIIPQNVNFAVKSNYLLNLISLLPDGKEIYNKTNSLGDLPIEKQIEVIQPFIVNIKAK